MVIIFWSLAPEKVLGTVEFDGQSAAVNYHYFCGQPVAGEVNFTEALILFDPCDATVEEVVLVKNAELIVLVPGFGPHSYLSLLRRVLRGFYNVLCNNRRKWASSPAPIGSPGTAD